MVTMVEEITAAPAAASPPPARPVPLRAGLAPVSVALLAAVVHRRRARAGFGLGTLAGLVFFGPLLEWTNLHTGVVPWVLLFVAESLFIGVLGAAAAYASPLVDRHRWTWPLLTGLLWVAQEAARDRLPFGGFPWGRLAFSQGDSPALRFAALGGGPPVTLGVAVVGGLLVAAAWRRWSLASAGLGAGAVALAAVGLVVPVGGSGGSGGSG